jgi:hypothetical protein
LDFSSKRLKPADKPSDAVQVPPLLKQLERTLYEDATRPSNTKKASQDRSPREKPRVFGTDILAHQEAKEAAAEL